MVIYEVNLKIASEAYEDYMAWILTHVQEMLQFPGFLEAACLKEYGIEDQEFKAITLQYRVESKKSLEHYLTNHAKAMREDGLRRFPGKFSVTRRTFEVIS